MKETKELKSLRLKVLKIVAKIKGLGVEKDDLFKKLQKECSHDEVLTTSYDNGGSWDGAEVCTGCGLHFSETYGSPSGPGSQILRGLPKKVKKYLHSDEFEKRRKEIFKKFGIS